MEMEIFKKIIEKKDVKVLSRYLFGFDPTPCQENLIRKIAYHDALGIKKISVKASTRYGKTKSVAIAICLHKILHSGYEYQLISPTRDKTNVLRTYIAEEHVKCRILSETLDLEASGLAHIKSEISKKKLTYKDGSKLNTLSADDPFSLMSHGGDVIVVDETGELDRETFNGYIRRMIAGRTKPTLLIEIGNPWDRNTHFGDHWNDLTDEWEKIKIDYRTGIKEGRFSEEFIEGERRTLSPIEFRVLYEAEFPDETEDQLIKLSWIRSAIEREINLNNFEKKTGLDVAEFGRDKSVLVKCHTDGTIYDINFLKSWFKKDTMETVGLALEYCDVDELINVDSTGVGSGVSARLKEMKMEVNPYKGGESPFNNSEKERFSNLLARNYWKLRDLFERGQISMKKISKNEEFNLLVSQLLSIKYEVKSDRKIAIIKPADKSPDHADGLCLAVADTKNKFIADVVRT